MKLGKRNLFTVGVVSILIGGLLGGTYWYSEYLKGEFWKSKTEQIEEITKQISHAFDIYLEKDRIVVDNLAKELSTLDSKKRAQIQADLRKISSQQATYILYNLDSHNYYISHSDKLQDLPRLSQTDISAVLKLSERGLREPYISNVDGRKTIGYYVRFNFSDGVPALLVKEVPVSEITEKFNLDTYDSNASTYIINRHGDILIRGNRKGLNIASPNLIDAMSVEEDNGQAIEAFKQSLEHKYSGVISFNYHDEEYLLVYRSLENTRNWYLTILIPNSLLDSAAKSVTNGSMVMLALMIFSLFILILTIRSRQDVSLIETKFEQEQAYKNQIYNALGSFSDDIFILLSGDAKTVEYISPNIHRQLGLPENIPVTDVMQIRDTMKSSTVEVNWTDLFKALPGSLFTRDSIRIHLKSGEEKFFSESFVKISAEGKEKFLVVLSDRTKEAKANKVIQTSLQRAEDANAAKSLFLSKMSHEIRTPLNTISLLVDVLRNNYANSRKVKECVEKLASASRLLQVDITDVLDMSKIESKTVVLNATEFSLPELINTVSGTIETLTAEKKQTFRTNVYNLKYEYLVGDEKKIEQILFNLLNNAAKYTSTGGFIQLTVTQKESVMPGNYAKVEFVVTDNGVGMSEEFQKVLFEPFTQAKNEMSAQSQGTGLGLCIAKGFVEYMNGNITVNSTLGHGTTFTVSLDLPIAKSEENSQFWDAHGVHSILLVSRDTNERENISKILSHSGLEVSAISVVQDIDQHAEENFDVVLVDWNGRDKDISERVEYLRNHLPKAATILLLLPFDRMDLISNAGAPNTDGYIRKPFYVQYFKTELQRTAAWKETDESNPTDVMKVFDGLNILIAEDNAINAAILAELLETEGATCEIAENGKIALEVFTASNPGEYDLILMDLQMPEMNGFEATENIRKSAHPDAKTIPIAATTANAFADDMERCFQCGMNSHQTKPLDLEKLAAWLFGFFKNKA